jgi:serine/threonine protein phosphatase 1
MSSKFSKVISVKGDRNYIIGDIHGCIDELEFMLIHLETQEKLTKKDLVLFIGDYVDRGKDSQIVIELLIDFKQRYPNTIFLKGNHEDMFIDFLELGDGQLGESYLYNGGVETIQSYGLSVFDPPKSIAGAIPDEHKKFLLDLESIAVVNNFICVHGGLNPIRKLEEQLDTEIFWIREQFIAYEHRFKKTVLFGHTPYQEIMVNLPYKIGLDTGLVFGNKLSCLETTEGKLFQIYRGDTNVQVSACDLSLSFR